ncbi:MAG: sarcosine oxidase subunit alpha [Halioglobus sp.]|jgi:sarcosine oxidase subunit alpha
MPANRLPSPYGLHLDRQQEIAFRFDGRDYKGFAGDTIASALAANQQWLLSRSFKYHRPRGVLTMAGQDANTLVHLPSDPNSLADRVEISEGLEVSAQNISGSLQRDRGALLSLFSRFLPVGFYYKAFFKPRGIWEFWAPLVRKKAGLGVIDQDFEPEYYDKQYRFYDVAVIGGGPAGMEAALQAARSGADVLLVDENPILGGSLNYARLDVASDRGTSLQAKLAAEVATLDNIDVMTDAICNGWFADNWLPVIKGKRLHKIRARETIMCVGALEQQAVFRNNDLPGVMMGSAAQRLMRLYGVRPGETAVVLTGNNDGYGIALDLIDAGVEVKAVIELRQQPQYDDIAQTLIDRGIPVRTGHAVYEALKAPGKNHLGAVDVRKIISQGRCEDSGETIHCDLLCMSVGYIPTYQLICQAGGQLSYDDDSAMFNLTKLPENFQIAGSVNGLWQLDAVRDDARRAAIIACEAIGSAVEETPAAVTEPDGDSPNFGWPIFAHPKGKEFVDFDEDLQIADIINATADGYEHIQLVKRYSTCGMGPSQGRHSALATARLVAAATNKTVAETGVTTARPPFAAERLAHSAGRSFYPQRRSNMHYRHIEAGAQMLQAGAWDRPAFYGAKDQRQKCIDAEVTNVRRNVGLVDVSTLGGIDVRGPDAGEFLNRFYTFGFVKQPVGKGRYALLTNEAGVVIDDGIACRLHEQHYYVTATTGGVDRVYQSMLKWNAQWRLDIDIANVTSAWCGVNIAGPNSRAVLKKLCEDVELTAEAFPYMGVREGTVAGISARLMRVGFVGELGYEVHVPQHCGEALWDAVMAAGEQHNIMPFGVEAQRVLRLEKAHIIIGQDTDAMSNPMEVQMNWAVSRKKPFFIGGRTIAELDKAPLQRSLVGFVIDDPAAPTPLESHLVLDGEQMTGRVTSCNYSPTLGQAIGLAYVPGSMAEPGQCFVIKSTGGVRVSAKVVSTPFYDPQTLRQEL